MMDVPVVSPSTFRIEPADMTYSTQAEYGDITLLELIPLIGRFVPLCA
jgi:hypothetical protein